MTISLGELAVRFGCELRGDPRALVDSVAALGQAHGRAVAFLADPRHRPLLAQTQAGAVVLESEFAALCPVAALVTANPRATYARIATLLYPREKPSPGVHPTAVVAADARVHSTAHIGALAVIGARGELGAGAIIGPHCLIDADVRVGEDSWLVGHVTLGRGVRIGPRALIHPGAVIGSDGFGFAPDAGTWIKVPQVGSVQLGADVEIGANTTIDRGAIGDTILEDGVKLDNQIQIGHNVRIGAHTVIAGCTGISGSTTIGKRCMIGGAVAVSGWLSICDDVVLTGSTSVSRSITQPGVYSGGIPCEDAPAWRKLVALFKRLPSLHARLTALERATGKRGEPQGSHDD
jgi:UDP-3-O-[3-hydroxymyristoyl] glucosamine N-acyltransferase